MKKVLFIGLLALSFNKPNMPPEPHTYIVKGDLGTWMYTHNYISKIQGLLVRTSNLPATQVAALNDTLSMIQTMIMNQIEPQWDSFRKEDSILNLKTKDSIKKK